jgi:predicted ATP-grasp superfamily ATP-dependent carboligase
VKTMPGGTTSSVNKNGGLFTSSNRFVQLLANIPISTANIAGMINFILKFIVCLVDRVKRRMTD